METVLLARHGQTEWNAEGRWQGQLDSPLTPLGLAQAATVARLVADQQVDAMFSSPLGRALSTARVCGEQLQLPITVLDELAEIHHGQMAGMTPAEMARAFPEEPGRRAADKYRWRFPGGESYQDAEARAAQALATIDVSGARRPLIVAHEMINRMLLGHLLRLDIATALAGGHAQGVVHRIDVATGEVTELRETANAP